MNPKCAKKMTSSYDFAKICGGIFQSLEKSGSKGGPTIDVNQDKDSLINFFNRETILLEIIQSTASLSSEVAQAYIDTRESKYNLPNSVFIILNVSQSVLLVFRHARYSAQLSNGWLSANMHSKLSLVATINKWPPPSPSP